MTWESRLLRRVERGPLRPPAMVGWQQLVDWRMAKFSEDELRWMEQWQYAAAALDGVRRQELRALTDQEAIMSTHVGPAVESTTSGLIVQQRIFRSR